MKRMKRLKVENYKGQYIDPDFGHDYSEVSFFESMTAPDPEGIVHVKIPKWLSKLIQEEVDRARDEGMRKKAEEITKALGIDD